MILSVWVLFCLRILYADQDAKHLAFEIGRVSKHETYHNIPSGGPYSKAYSI